MTRGTGSISGLITGLLAAGAVLAAAPAQAQPLPEPEPVPVGPEQAPPPESPGAVPGEIRVSAPTVGGSQTSTTDSYLDPINTVPNINGDPCTGQWESVACYAMHYDTPPAVQPRSSLSASP